MFTGTRFVLLAPLLVPSYVLALLVETVRKRVWLATLAFCISGRLRISLRITTASGEIDNAILRWKDFFGGAGAGI